MRKMTRGYWAILATLVFSVAVLAAPPVKLWGVNGTSLATALNPVPVANYIGGVVAGATNGGFTNILQGNAVLSATNGLFSNLLQGNAVLSATNGLFANILQSNAVLSASNPIFAAPDGVAQASITNTTASVPNTSTDVTLAAASRHITVKTDPTAAVLYVDFANGTATTADFRVEPGGAVTLDSGVAITTFKVIGASATGTFSVLGN